jgi:hypothetical protein
MTHHLSESEFVDLAENESALDAGCAAHVETCASCREQLDALRAMLRETATVEVPDPSPRFWEHMSNRVRAGVAAEPTPLPGWNGFGFGIRGLMPLAVAAVLFLAVYTGLVLRPIGPHEGSGSRIADRVASVAPAAVSSSAPARPAATPDGENAEVWAVLTAAASDIAFEDAHAAGMHVLPAAIDHAVQDLTEAELTELGRLLQSELKRSSN